MYIYISVACGGVLKMRRQFYIYIYIYISGVRWCFKMRRHFMYIQYNIYLSVACVVF